MLAETQPDLIAGTDPLARHRLHWALTQQREARRSAIRVPKPGDGRCRPLEIRAELQADLDNDSKSTKRPRVKFVKVISCNVLYNPPSCLGNLSAGLNHFHADDPVANRSRCPKRSLRIGCNDPADRRRGPIPGIERQKLLVFQQSALKLFQCDSGLDMYGQICGNVFGYAGETRQIDGTIRTTQRIAERQLAAGSDRDDSAFFAGNDF